MFTLARPSAFSLFVKCLIYFILGFALVATVVCICGYDPYRRGFNDYLWVPVFAMVAGAGIYLWARILHRFTEKQVVWTGLALANLLMAFFLLSFWTVPVSDYSNVFGMGVEMANGTYDIDTKIPYGYGYLYNWQTGMAFLESLFLRFGHPSAIPLKILNVFLINATLLLTYVVVKRLADRLRAAFSFLPMCVFYPMLVSVGQLSNQNVVAPLILILILLIERHRYLWAGILVPIISFVRPMGTILVIAVAVWLLYLLLRRLEPWKTVCRQAAAFAVPFIILTVVLNAAMIGLGYAKGPVSSPTLPYFKFYQGLYIEEWNDPAEKIESFGGDVDKYNAWTREQVMEAYRDRPGETIGNNFKKMAMLLGMYDWKFAYSYNQIFPEFDSRAVSIGVAFGWAEYLVLIVLCLLGFGAYHRRNGADFVQILFIGLVCVYFFIEAWPDYRYDFYSLMFIIASFAYPLKPLRGSCRRSGGGGAVCG